MTEYTREIREKCQEIDDSIHQLSVLTLMHRMENTRLEKRFRLFHRVFNDIWTTLRRF